MPNPITDYRIPITIYSLVPSMCKGELEILKGKLENEKGMI